MYATADAPLRARWEIMWIDDKRIVREPFGHDLLLAVQRYAQLHDEGRTRGLTLRCCNMGFPPPDKYADRETVVITVKGKRKRGKRIIKPHQYIETMGELNLRGIWWCPYCQTMRKFVYRKGFKTEGVWVPQDGIHCPMCGISAMNGHVRRYNPMSLKIEMQDSRQSLDPSRNTDQAQRRRERRAARKAKEKA